MPEIQHAERPLSRELATFASAVQFLTRLPVPATDYREDILGRSLVYFPLVGLLVGAIVYLAFSIAVLLWPTPIAVVFALLAAVLCTGAFHEDGLADTADGIGGGWTTEDKLRIMKDSRIGTYGGLALVVSMLMKFAALCAIPPANLLAALLSAHMLGRWSTLALIRTTDYLGGQTGSGRPFATALTPTRALLGSLPYLVVLVFIAGAHTAALLAVTLGLCAACRWYFKRKLGGITGDSLGAANQVVEIAVYLIFAAV